VRPWRKCKYQTTDHTIESAGCERSPVDGLNDTMVFPTGAWVNHLKNNQFRRYGTLSKIVSAGFVAGWQGAKTVAG